MGGGVGELWGGGGLWHVPVNVLLRLFLWFSPFKHFVVTSTPHKRCSVCTCTAWLGRGLLYQSLFDGVLINNIATCLGMTFLYTGACVR